jgi:hypothetical protein
MFANVEDAHLERRVRVRLGDERRHLLFLARVEPRPMQAAVS